ncbi:DUF6011 domain-containing protein [Streptomyces liangshanensis]|uniref:Uncharacterized protein n=1 Tax=Streptomyces liangshanensis TaxID=2717324 RepID=A0A6G9GS44_9ACTN|nr:DUF6011 domain-containing protein [Streptomyces liangshanensis]QIQ00896.1 hypothetical protein HA039_30275 [Streptomyces liangshanensis]
MPDSRQPDLFPPDGPAPGPPPGSAPEPARGLVRCRMCGRPLRGTASRRSGLGPDCDAKLHPPAPDIRTRRREADQDPIPGF